MTEPMDAAGRGNTAGNDPLDQLIAEALQGEWCKVAVFISRVVDAAKAAGLEPTGQAVAARLYLLADEGLVEVQGNVRRWRAASVRRPGVKPDVSPPTES